MSSYPPAVEARVRDLVLARLADENPVHGPGLYPCTCGAPHHVHDGKTRNGKHDPTGCKRYRQDIAYELAERVLDAHGASVVTTITRHANRVRAAERKHRPARGPREWGVSASDVTNCRRAIWYREDPPEGFVPDWEDKRAATLGGIIHKAAEVADAAEHPWRQHEEPLRLEGLDAHLRYDRYDPITAEVTDDKTAGRWKWDQIADGPEERAWWQPQLYGLALTRAGRPVRTVRMVYINRETGHEEQFVRPYDEAVALQALAWLLDICTQLDLGEELPRDRKGPGLDGLCDRCFARTHCWGLPAAQAAGRSPQSWTYLGPTPAERDVELTLLAYDEARARAKEANDAKDFTKALLNGIPLGRYGSMEYQVTVSWIKDEKKYTNALEEAWDLPPLVRPSLAEMAPKAERRESIRVKRVREAKQQKERAMRKRATPKPVTTARVALEGTVIDPAPMALEQHTDDGDGEGDAA